MVDSRIFVTQSKVRKFIPMFDMGNDNENPNALRVSDGDKGETMIAAKNIKKGQEISWNYLGAHQFSRTYFIKYGIVKPS